MDLLKNANTVELTTAKQLYAQACKEMPHLNPPTPEACLTGKFNVQNYDNAQQKLMTNVRTNETASITKMMLSCGASKYLDYMSYLIKQIDTRTNKSPGEQSDTLTNTIKTPLKDRCVDSGVARTVPRVKHLTLEQRYLKQGLMERKSLKMRAKRRRL